MTKRKCSNLILILLMSIFLSSCSLIDGLLFTKDAVPEYSFSGYVYADGNPLSGAIVDCGLNSTTTNDEGYYSFSGLKKAVEVSVEKDGYIFDDNAKNVSTIASNISFSGYEIFEKGGYVKNGDTFIEGVSICAVSKGGTYNTTTNDMGKFYLKNLAGTVKVTATKDKFSFFTQSFGISKEDEVIVSGSVDLLGRIACDIDGSADDFDLKLNGARVEINDDLSFALNSVSMNDELVLSSDTYHIENQKLTIKSESDIVFDCKKLYSVSGTVACGNVPLSGVTISVGQNSVVSENGRFELPGLYGEGVMKFALDGYTFDDANVSYSSNTLDVEALTSVSLSVNLDSGNDYKNISIKVGDKVFDTCTRQGVFTLNGIKFGDRVEVVANDYASVEPFVILNRTPISVSLNKLYNANVIVKCGDDNLDGVKVYVDGTLSGETADSGMAISGLYGEHTITLEKDGFLFFDDYSVNYFNQNVVGECYKLFDIVGAVHSGVITLSNAKITYRGQDYYSDENGEFEISNAYGESEIEAICEGYNSASLSVDISSKNQDINLDYDISGEVLCGTDSVSGVKVGVNGQEVLSDKNGRFEFSGLVGQNEISFEKEHYEFESVTVSNSQNLAVQSTYEIVGNVNTSEGAVANLEISLIGANDIKTTTTDKDGNYSFTGLSGSYTLHYSDKTMFDLKPKKYDVKEGGNYNFSNKGFNFGGVVTCGDAPLEGVTVTIGSNKVTTDASGQYLFPLVTQSGVITLSKEGYTFEGSGTTITEDFADRRDVNFDATYKVEVLVTSGKTMLDGVMVSLDGEQKGRTQNGTFEISGLSGEHNLSLVLNKYKFVGETSVNGYKRLSFQAFLDVCVTLKTGDVNVSGVGYSINGKEGGGVSDENGELVITDLKLGDQITFSKTNYTFESKKLDEYTETLSVDSSYKISGTISNCGSPLEGVRVSIVGDGEKSVLSDTQGRFEFDGIVGTITLNFEKLGFEFENVQVSSAEAVLARCKYSVSGTIKLASGAKGTEISGVKVYDGEKLLATSANDGSFVIEGLSSVVSLTFVKYGYTFEGEYEVGEPTSGMVVYGTYEISGRVTSGSIAIPYAKVSVGTRFETKTDADGYYTIKGLDGSVEVDVSVNGYDTPLPVTVKGYTSGANFELTYSVVISVISGEYKDITVAVSGETNRTNKYSVGTITISGLKGKNSIKLTKSNYKINPTDTYLDIKTNETIEISTQLVYTIKGTVKTAEGVVVPYAIISVGETTAKADENGKYEISGLVGKNELGATLPFGGYTNIADIQKSFGQVETSGTYDIVFSAKAFWLGLLNHSYDNLRNGNGYQIVGTGTVNAVADIMSIKSDSTVDVHYRQDKNGIKVFENKNNGGVAAGVDPNVSLLTLYNTKTGEVKSQFVAGEDEVKETTVNYPATWNAWNNGSIVGGVEAYKNKYGVDIDGFSPYIINMNTINSATKVSDSGNDYVFKLDMNTITSVANYNILMGVMCNKKDMKGFSSIVLTFTISKTGYIKEMKMAEKYTVVTNSNASISGASANVTGNITYTFYTNENNTIKDIDISTPLTAVANIRTLETYDDVTKLNSIKKASTPKFDLIVCKKEEIL